MRDPTLFLTVNSLNPLLKRSTHKTGFKTAIQFKKMVWPGGNWTQEAEFFRPPDFVERKGSLYLRSNNMQYSKNTLNSDWDSNREAYPKDFDIVKSFKRRAESKNENAKKKTDLHLSTYSRIGTENNRLPLTTAQDGNQQAYDLKPRWTPKAKRKLMVNKHNFETVNLQEPNETGPEFLKILPKHKSDYRAQHFSTTNRIDYRRPYPKDKVVKLSLA